MSKILDSRGRTAEERAELKALRDKINLDAQENWNNPEWHREMAAAITEEIDEGFEFDNVLDLFTDVQSVGEDDRVFVQETRGLRAFWVAEGGYIEESTLTADRVELPRDIIGFHVSGYEPAVRSGFAETQATLIRHGVDRLLGEVNRYVLSTFQAAISSGDSNYTAGAGLSLSALNTALRTVRDESRSGEITIVGRATMIDQVIDQILVNNSGASFVPETNESILRTGVLGVYRGARIVTLNKWEDDNGDAFFPANELFVIGRDASKAAFYGGSETKEFTEQDNWYWHYLQRRRFGIMVHRPERAHRFVDTNTAP